MTAGVQTIKISQNGLVWSGPRGLGKSNGLVWSGPVWPGQIMVWSGVDHYQRCAQMVWSGLVRSQKEIGLMWMKLCNDAVTNRAEGVPNAVSREARVKNVCF